MSREFRPNPEQASPKPIEKLAEFLQGEKSDSIKRYAAEDVTKLAILKHELRTAEKEIPESMLIYPISTHIKRIEKRIHPTNEKTSNRDITVEAVKNFTEKVFSLYVNEAIQKLKAHPFYVNYDDADFISLANHNAAREIERDFATLNTLELRRSNHLVVNLDSKNKKKDKDLPPKQKNTTDKVAAREQKLIELWPDHKISDIAQELGISEGYVRDIASKARTKGVDVPSKQYSPKPDTDIFDKDD